MITEFNRADLTLNLGSGTYRLPDLFKLAGIDLAACQAALRLADLETLANAARTPWLGEGHAALHLGQREFNTTGGESLAAHRVVKELALGTLKLKGPDLIRTGAVPKLPCFVNICGVPGCLNPAHTEILSRSEVAKAAYTLGKGASAQETWALVKGWRDAGQI